MSDLFGNNLYFIYFFACLTVINYTGFEEKQRVFLIYLITFSVVFFDVFSIKEGIIFLIIITFVYLEILSSDKKKLQLLNLSNRIMDYIYRIFTQYHIHYVILSMLLCSTVFRDFANEKLKIVSFIFDIIAISVFLLCILKVISQKFEIKSIDKMIAYFEKKPINMFDKETFISKDKLAILIYMEDRTFFEREKSFNFISKFFLVIAIKKIKNFDIIKKIRIRTDEKYSKIKIIRGYSTIEMQLIRNIGISRGYSMSEHIVKRKVFELCYTHIILSSMKNFYDENIYVNRENLKHFIISIYVDNVNTKILEEYIPVFSKAYEKEISEWSKEEFFIAVAGLTHSTFTAETIFTKYSDIISNFQLDEEKIKSVLTQFEK
ncbi:hypothetical protein [Brochothrix thermosphacta]|uniref:hypothetical protein n=1 Tax=Brochothrix thermosphacta TaxID=2756 RepID=UPI00265D0875|nr:hypothetical protein [Brochothrix thermosphacta]WKK69243.1 hypothetical protein Q0G00_00985 [Brochothrix thermosphacta]